MPDPSLSAREVNQALRERIARGIYARGSRLPPVRALAEEMHTSPSTVSRALQGLEHAGWIHVAQRRGAQVALRMPSDAVGNGPLLAEMRALVRRWRLGGGDRDSLLALFAAAVADGFEQEAAVYFLECNGTDLAQMAAQVQEQAPVPVSRMLIAEARAHPERLRAAVVITPFFHLAEIRALVPPDADVVPLNFVPSEAVLGTLAELPASALVGVIGADDRSVRRLHGLVDQFSVAAVRVATVAESERVAELLRTSDAIVTVAAAGLSDAQRAQARRLVMVDFVLETGSPGLTRLGAATPDPGPEPAGIRP